jgi:alpha-L-arabinofuranosidase
VGFPLVDALACRHSDGRLTVVLLNRHPTAALELRLDLENGTVERNARLALLTGRTWHAQNEPHRPERVLPRTRRLRLGRDGRTRLELPPASLVLLETREPPKEKR